jgi:UDP-N-acetylmuramoyl-tripeptide--D-alanyl-D-alanine ligase
MMRFFWTRFGINYPQVITYMLQESDYRITDYYKWLGRTDDFRKVIKRRKLVYTSKAIALWLISWITLIILYIFVIFLIVQSIASSGVLELILAVVVFTVTPLVVAYGIVIPLWIGHNVVQIPKQQRTISSARKILTDHPGLKIAVAGSYGKTTAKEILSTILSEGKKVAFTPGNMNTPIGISRFVETLDGSEEIIIFELGEEQVGDIKALCELIRPDIGIITGINEAHLSSFGTIKRTIATIFELKDYLGDKPLYKNIESPLVATKVDNKDNLAYSQDGTNGWTVSAIRSDIKGLEFTAVKGPKTVFAQTSLLGAHNIGVIMVAIDIADSVEVSIPDIYEGVKKTKPFEHRMHPRHLHGAWLIDDTYNGNSEGVKVGLKLLKELEAKRRIYVTPGLVEQGDKTREVHEEIGRQIASVADVVVLMQNSVTDYISKGLQEGKYKGRLLVIDNPLEFYTHIDHFVASGDVVLMQNDWTDNFA